MLASPVPANAALNLPAYRFSLRWRSPFNERGIRTHPYTNGLRNGKTGWIFKTVADDTKTPNSTGRDVATGRFSAGNPGGPGGRRRMPEAELTMLGEAWPKAVRRLIEGLDAVKYVGMMAREVPDWKERRETACEIRDTLYGKPSQAITDADGGPVRMGLIFLPQVKPDDAG